MLDIVQRVGKLLESKLGAQVIYTRQDDSYLPLEKRAEIANLAKADLFLSVHANYSDLSTARGVETYYTNTYSSIKARSADDDPALKQVDWTGVDIRAKVTDSHRLAADVQQALCGGLVAMNPDLRNRGVKKAQYVVLTGTQMPAVLAEVSFVSSPEEEDHLQSSEYRQYIADALYRGVAKYHEDLKPKNTKLASAKKLAQHGMNIALVQRRARLLRQRDEVRPVPRQKWAISNLPVKFSRPPPRQGRSTVGTAAVRGKAILLDEITVAPNENTSTVLAVTIF